MQDRLQIFLKSLIAIATIINEDPAPDNRFDATVEGNPFFPRELMATRKDSLQMIKDNLMVI